MLNFHCNHFQTWCTRAFDITRIDENSEIVCFLGHYLHFTFFAVKKKEDAKAGKLVAVRTRGPDGKIRTAGARAISQSDSRTKNSGPLRCITK